MQINPLMDAEARRQQKNMTQTQRKTHFSTKEGVIVNSLIKENEPISLNDTYNSMVITEKERLPHKIYENTTTREKSLLPVAGVSLGVMGAVAILSMFVKRNAKNAMELVKEKEKWLPTVTRNVNLSEETTQAIYQMVQNPSRTSVIAGTGVLALSAMAFMGKTFLEGYKDIWLKKKDADIQKNLQEKLIDVETQSFAGKMQIIRSMLSKQAADFDNYLSGDNKILSTFGQKTLKSLYFTSSDTKKEEPKKSGWKYLLMGLATVGSIIGLGYFAFKNASKSKGFINDYLKQTEEKITAIVANSSSKTQKTDMVNLENSFKIMDATEDYIREKMSKVNWGKEETENFVKRVASKIRTSTTKVNPNIGGDGTSKPAFNSFVNDYRAFFYNWLLDTSNPQFKQLFFGVTGVAATAYGGKLYGEAIKDVQVKKFNAETELNLQKRLVSTELRNFKSKKDAAIQPLVDEFYRQAANGKSKEELKVIADNILFEIKNGAPFVYS